MTWKTERYSGWGRALWVEGPRARPERASHLGRLLNDRMRPAIGQRRSYGDACLVDGKEVIDTTRMDRVISFDEDTGLAHLEAGARLGDLAQVFAPKGWLPPVMPGTGFATLGGAIAMDVHGKNHHHAGSFGAHVTELTLIQGGKSKVVKAGSALFNATLGGLGQTGVIRSAKVTFKRAKGDVMMVTERRAEGWDAFLKLLDASEATYTVGWIDATATGERLGRGILEEGETGSGLVPKPKAAKKVPFEAPRWALSPLIVQAFNALYYARVPKAGRTVVKPIQDFFFPLDRIHDWNKLYGKGGFHQFQCVVPVEAADKLKEMLKLIVKSGQASPLAVLKRMGPGGSGLMSFPMEGYTLAVDLRAGSRAELLISELEDATLDAGGRIYLAKDALASPEVIKAMYPDFESWRKAVVKADPEGDLQTDLVKRLKLRDPA